MTAAHRAEVASSTADFVPFSEPQIVIDEVLRIVDMWEPGGSIGQS